MREQYAIDAGDIVSLKMELGKIAVKKAILLEDNVMPLAAKVDYVRAVLKELTPDQLAEVLEQTVKLLKPLCPPF